MEDVTVLGYKPIARQNCVDLDQCMMILKSMAKLHGISFAYKDQEQTKFQAIAESLHETYFSTQHWNWYKRFHVKLKTLFNFSNINYDGILRYQRFFFCRKN